MSATREATTQDAWLASGEEEALEPELRICDPHHHLWDRSGSRYLLLEIGFRALNEQKYESFIPFVGRLPILKNLFRRKALIDEKRSLYILLTAQVVDLREEEKKLFN